MTTTCLLVQPKGVPRRFTPILMGVREEATDGAYTLVLEFAKRKVRVSILLVVGTQSLAL